MNNSSPQYLTESRYGWYQVAVAFTANGTMNGILVYGYSLLIVLVAEQISANVFEQMWPKTAMMLSSAMFVPIIGLLVERFPVRRLLVVGTALMAGGLLFVSRANSIVEIAIIFAIFFGPLQGLVGPQTLTTLVSRWFTRRRTMAIGMSVVGVSAGGFIAPLAINGLADALYWRDLFMVLACISLIIMILPIVLLVKEHPDDFQSDGSGENSSDLHATELMSLREIFSRPEFWALGFAMAIMYGTNVAVISNLVQIAMDGGLTRTNAAQALAFMAIMGVIGKVIFGYLGDRFNKAVLLLLVCCCYVLGQYLLIGVSSVLVLVGVCMFIGTTFSGALPLWHALTVQLFGVTNFAKVIGLKMSLSFLMITIGPPVAGWLFERFESYTPALYIFTGVSSVSIALIVFVCFRSLKVLQTN